MTRQEGARIAREAKAAKLGSVSDRFWAKVDIKGTDDCWLWTACVRRKDEGYGAFWLNGRHQPASRIAWALTNGDIEPALHVCHKCDNPKCCNPSHMFIGSNDENMADRSAKGRQMRGEKVPNAILNEEMVRELRKLASEIGPTAAARRYGLKPGTVRDACTRTWRHVK